jgi:oligoribonuclease
VQCLCEHSPRVQAPLAGNSVHMDKMFLRKHMPNLDAFLHFRIVDVSTVNELSRRWVPGKLSFLPRKTQKHTAMSDLLESLEELRIYQEHMFQVKVKGQAIFVAYNPN